MLALVLGFSLAFAEAPKKDNRFEDVVMDKGACLKITKAFTFTDPNSTFQKVTFSEGHKITIEFKNDPNIKPAMDSLEIDCLNRKVLPGNKNWLPTVQSKDSGLMAGIKEALTSADKTVHLTHKGEKIVRTKVSISEDGRVTLKDSKWKKDDEEISYAFECMNGINPITKKPEVDGLNVLFIKGKESTSVLSDSKQFDRNTPLPENLTALIADKEKDKDSKTAPTTPPTTLPPVPCPRLYSYELKVDEKGIRNKLKDPLTAGTVSDKAATVETDKPAKAPGTSK